MDHDAYGSYHATNLEAQTARATPVELVLVLITWAVSQHQLAANRPSTQHSVLS